MALSTINFLQIVEYLLEGKRLIDLKYALAFLSVYKITEEALKIVTF